MAESSLRRLDRALEDLKAAEMRLREDSIHDFRDAQILQLTGACRAMVLSRPDARDNALRLARKLRPILRPYLPARVLVQEVIGGS